MLFKKAFTLAEVLIAMTIIGVVAALTVPNLMADTSSSALRTKFKATYVQFQNGLIHAENVQKHAFVDVGVAGTNNAKYNIDQFMNHHFKAKRINRAEGPAGITYELKSGAQIIFPQATQTIMTNTGCDNSHPCTLYIDVNGRQGPNEIVECTSGTTDGNNILTACTVDANVITDIFPIQVRKSQVLPKTNAVNYILNN